MVGDWVTKYPESVKALADAGHEVMNHSDDHAHFNSLSREQIVADITACNEKIAAVTGKTPTLFRPPYGEYNDHVVTTVRSMGMEPIQWDVETLDAPSIY
ncbi:MAG: Chitooligosaccharide deacetylase [Firmicutes bacterium]|nr:Chitooligosaccharide deacetylase [Bacillota bacterium]